MSASESSVTSVSDEKQITVNLGDRSYPIVIGTGLLERSGELCRRHGLAGNALLIASESVGALYGGVTLKSLGASGFAVHCVTIPDGEEYKTLETVDRLYDACVDARLDRGSFILALGGGVVGDVSGFVAATYMRGISYVQIPTTLLAQVDASVGGKTAINRPAAKNLVGAFHQPRLVLADVATLVSLPRREFVSGLAEVVKHGLIADRGLFEHCEASAAQILRQEREPLEYAILRSVEIKAAVVEQDEREGGLRAILNFGHTVGHAIEQAAKYGTYTHGEAVAIGMAVEGRMSVERGMLNEADWRRMVNLLQRLGLPVATSKIAFSHIVDAMMKDKKAESGRLRFALLEGLGGVKITSDVTLDEVERAYSVLA